jgi:hypothetical protein
MTIALPHSFLSEDEGLNSIFELKPGVNGSDDSFGSESASNSAC